MKTDRTIFSRREKYLFQIFVILTVLSVITSDRIFIIPYIYGIPFAKDVDQLNSIYDEIISKHKFGTKYASDIGRTIGGRAGTKYLFGAKPHMIYINGVADESEQKEIAQTAFAYYIRKKTLPIRILFYEGKDSRPEKLINTINIPDSLIISERRRRL